MPNCENGRLNPGWTIEAARQALTDLYEDIDQWMFERGRVWQAKHNDGTWGEDDKNEVVGGVEHWWRQIEATFGRIFIGDEELATVRAVDPNPSHHFRGNPDVRAMTHLRLALDEIVRVRNELARQRSLSGTFDSLQPLDHMMHRRIPSMTHSDTAKAVAQRARDIADRIEKLPYAMRDALEADSKPDPAEIRGSLNPTPLNVDAFPVVTFIERHWTPDHAGLFAQRIELVCNGVHAFLDAYSVLHREKQNRSNARNDPSGDNPVAIRHEFNRHEMAKFLVVAKLAAAYIRDWANEFVGERSDGALEAHVAEVTAPAQIIEGYKRIFAELGIKHRDSTEFRTACRALKRKSESNGGPIQFRDKRPPIVERLALLTWWNSQLNRQDEAEQRRRDRNATLSGGYAYGRQSIEVKPDIGGYVRGRAN